MPDINESNINLSGYPLKQYANNKDGVLSVHKKINP